MPRRKRTRTQDHDRCIHAERDYNAAVIAGEEPPPF
jgi:hypothetical protein